MAKGKELNETQQRLVSVMYANLMLGLVIMVTFFAFSEMFTYGLWHKILVFPFYFPIGLVLYIILTALCTTIVILTLKFDYNVIVKGLDWVKIDKKKPVTPTNDVLNDMENP